MSCITDTTIYIYSSPQDVPLPADTTTPVNRGTTDLQHLPLPLPPSRRPSRTRKRRRCNRVQLCSIGLQAASLAPPDSPRGCLEGRPRCVQEPVADSMWRHGFLLHSLQKQAFAFSALNSTYCTGYQYAREGGIIPKIVHDRRSSFGYPRCTR